MLGAVEAGTPTVPYFLLRIALAAKQNVFPVRPAGHQHRHGLGLGKMGEIIEVAIGAILVINVAIPQTNGRRGDNCDAALHVLHQFATPLLEYLQVHGSIMPQTDIAGDSTGAASIGCYNRIERVYSLRAAELRTQAEWLRSGETE